MFWGRYFWNAFDYFFTLLNEILGEYLVKRKWIRNNFRKIKIKITKWQKRTTKAKKYKKSKKGYFIVILFFDFYGEKLKFDKKLKKEPKKDDEKSIEY